MLAVSAAGHAAAPTELRPYLGLGLQYIPTDHDERASDYGVGLYTGGGAPINKWFALEGEMFYDVWERDSAPNDFRWKDYGAQAGGLLTIPVGNGWIPFFSAHGGVAKSRLKSVGSSTDLTYSLGGGFFYLFDAWSRDWGFRFDARYRTVDIGDSAFGDGSIASAGFDDKIGEAVVRFGIITMIGKRPEAPKAAAPAVDPDSDGDGVPDSKDQCPDTPKGVKVDANGCPLAAQVGDPADALKRYGPVYFDFDKSDLKPAERAKLDTAAKEIDKLKNGKIIIKLYGHTDSVGTPEYNQALGERRATVVKKYLIAKGVKAEKIEITSYGESKPAADNDTDEGRALNRRVEVLVVEE